MKRIFLGWCVLVVFLSAQSADYVITDYGVNVDSTRMNTQAIQSIIDKVSTDGGGTIVIPKGVFLSGALFLNRIPNFV